MNAWQAVARAGEAQILLPALVAVCAWAALRGRAARMAARALLATALATAVTTVTKVAFIGYEIGYAPWDYTGVAGHSMFAAAAWPLIVAIALGPHAPRWRVPALAGTYGLAGFVSVSRMVTGAHSPSEVMLGYALGASASALALRCAAPAPRAMPAAGVALLLAWLVAAPAGAPPSRTHGWVTALALAVSGRPEPYTREQMLARRLGVPAARVPVR